MNTSNYFKDVPYMAWHKAGSAGKCTYISRENFKTNQQELNVNSEVVPGLKVLLRPQITYSSKNKISLGTKQHSMRNSQGKKRKGHPYLFGLDCWGTAVPTIIVAEGSVVDGVTVVVPHERLESEKAERLRTWTWINSSSCQNKMKPWRSHIVCNITDCPEKQEIIIPLSFQSRQKKKDTRALVGFSHPTWEDASRILIWLGPENSIKASKFVSPFDNFKLTFWNYVGKEEGYV